VVYSHRPGYQTQFSGVLSAQVSGAGEFSELISWIGDNLAKPLKVDDLAEKANMSLRTFHRKFTRVTGLTPSKYIDIARMEQARQLLETGMPPKVVGPQVGFSSLSGFRASYRNRFGISPNMQRLMHTKDVLREHEFS
jgi:transcriptional regulator GlxA family with amidase domain